MLPSQPLIPTKTSKRNKYGCRSCCILCLVVIIFVAIFIWSNTASFTNHGSLQDLYHKAVASSIFIASQKPPNIQSIRYNVQDVKEFLNDHENGPESDEWSAFHQELISLSTNIYIEDSMDLQFEMHDDDYYITDTPIVAYRERKRKSKKSTKSGKKSSSLSKPAKSPRVKSVKAPKPVKSSKPNKKESASAPAPLPTTPYPTPQAPANGYSSNLHCWTNFKDYSYYAPESTVNVDCGYNNGDSKGYVRTGCMARHLYTTKHWGVQLTRTKYDTLTVQGCESRTNENLGTWVGARCCEIYNDDAMEWPSDDNAKNVLSESDSNFDDDQYEGSCAESNCNDDDSDRVIVGCNAHSEPNKAAQFGFMGSRIDENNVCMAQNEIAWSMVVSQSVCAQSVKGGTLECIRVDEEERAIKVYDDGHQKTYRSKGVTCPDGYSMTDCNAYVHDGNNHGNAFECANEVSILSFSSDRSYGEYIIGDCCQAWGSTDKMRAQISCCRVVANDIKESTRNN